LSKSLTKLLSYAVCALLPVGAAAQAPEQPVFDSFSYVTDPLFTPRLIRSRIVLPTRPAVAAPVAAPVMMNARDEQDMRLAIDKAASQILKLTVDYTELLKVVDTLRAEKLAKQSGWSVFSNDPAEKPDTAQLELTTSVTALQAELDKSHKQVAKLEAQLASVQGRLNAAQANFEGETTARLLTEQRLVEARAQLTEAKQTTAQAGTAQDIEGTLQQRDAHIAQLESDLAASRAKLAATPALVTASAPGDTATSPSELITGLVSAVPVREWIIAGLEFELGSTDIKQGTETNLNTLLTYLQQQPKIEIQVDGYTDSIGSVADNLKLSRDRAQAVADYLIKRGIDAHRIRVVGYGEGRPIATNMYQAGRAQNRRVAIIFFGPFE